MIGGPGRGAGRRRAAEGGRRWVAQLGGYGGSAGGAGRLPAAGERREKRGEGGCCLPCFGEKERPAGHGGPRQGLGGGRKEEAAGVGARRCKGRPANDDEGRRVAARTDYRLGFVLGLGF